MCIRDSAGRLPFFCDVPRQRGRFSCSPSDSARKTAQSIPSGALGTEFEAVLGPAQFKLRKPEA
eukprot:11554072-Alexandrium_andersonii.AAC.1